QLKITKEQREAARKVEKEFSEAERKLVLSEKPAAEIEKGLKQLEEATTVRFRALLTADQQKKVPDLLGERFTGEARRLPPFRNRRGGGPGPGGFPPTFLTAPLFVNTQAVTLITQQASIREELKLTKEELDKVTAIRTEWTEKLFELRQDSGGDE